MMVFVQLLLTAMGGNGLAAAPLDLSNWMAALEPIVGNNTLLDLSVSTTLQHAVVAHTQYSNALVKLS